MAQVRVSQVAVRAIVQTTTEARVTQFSTRAIVQSSGQARVTQFSVRAIIQEQNNNLGAFLPKQNSVM